MATCRTSFEGKAGVLALALFALTACSSGEPPQAQLGATSQAIGTAEQQGALQYAPAELQTAREKLNAALAASRDEDYEEARRLAEQAQADAELATARSRTASAQQAASQVQKDIQALQQQPGMTTGSGSSTAPTMPSGTTVPPRY